MRRAAGLALVLTAVVILAGQPRTAFGHAALVRSEPAANAFLQRPPGEVVLAFTEPVDSRASNIRVLDARGLPVTLTRQGVSPDGLTLRASLPVLKPGIYNVLWVNVSSIDGHSLSGSYPFTALNPDGSVPGGGNVVVGLGTDIDPAPLPDGVAARALSLLGLLLIAGGAVLLLLFGDPPAPVRRGLGATLLLGAAVLVVATLLNLAVLRDAYRSLGLVNVMVHTRGGGYWLSRIGLAAFIAAVASFVPDAPRRSAGAALAAAAVYLWAYSATSHAAAGSGSSWAMAIDYAHGVAAILWIGAVVGIAVSARMAGRRGDYRKLVPRFSLTASLLVFVLLATGTLSAFVEVDTPSRLWGTRYGVTLLLKLGLLVPLLAVAAYNARRGVKRLAARAPGEPHRFLRSVAVEAFLGLVVIALAATLTQTTVSKSVIDTPESKPFAAKTTVNDLSIALAIDPNRTGLNTYLVDLVGASGAAVTADRVRLTFRYRDDQTVGPSTLVLAAGDTPGRFSGQGPFLTLEGQWRVEVEVRRPGVDDAIGFFDVRPAGAAVAGLRRGGRWDNPAPGLTWNEFGGLVVLLVGLGFALWGSRLGRWDRRVGRAGTVVTALSFGIGALLLFGVHAHTTTTKLPRNPIYPDQNSVALGRQLYQNNCVSCHGQNGVPPKGLDLNPYPLDLTLHVPQHPDGQLYNFIALGLQGSAMRAWGESPGKLTSDQVWHLVNFLRTLGTVDQ